MRGERLSNFVFEEEYIHISQGVIGNDQDHNPIPEIFQELTLNQDNVIKPPA